MSDDDGWRYVGFTDGGNAYDQYGEPLDLIPPDLPEPRFIEPDDVPEVETIDPGDYL